MAKPKKTEKSVKAPAKKQQPKGKDKKADKKAPKAKPAKAPKAEKKVKGVTREVFVKKLGEITSALGAEKPGKFKWAGKTVTVPIDATFKIELDKDEEKKDGRIEIEFEIKWKK
jgi:hypothetical protein